MTQKQGAVNRPVTLRDIAARCGMSKSSVSRALQGPSPHVTEENYEMILRVAREMGYDPANGHLARRLAFKKVGKEANNQILAIFMPFHNFFEFPFTVSIMRGVYEELAPKGYGLIMYYTGDHTKYRLPDIFTRGDVDGAIIIDNPYKFQPVVNQLKALPGFSNRPSVSLLNHLDNMPECSSVLPDYRAGGYAMASHLLDMGHRHMLQFWSTEDDCLKIPRVAGYCQAYTDRGLSPERYLHSIPDIPNLFEPVGKAQLEAAVIKMLRHYPQITALLSRNDVTAAHCRSCLIREGIRVPQDVSIVGFDDIDPINDDCGNNILTSLRLPLTKIGQAGAQLLLNQVYGEAPHGQEIVLPVELVVRKTTAPPPK